MIVFDLHCKDGHRFEGWFGSAKDFASQKKRGLLSLPDLRRQRHRARASPRRA